MAKGCDYQSRNEILLQSGPFTLRLLKLGRVDNERVACAGCPGTWHAARSHRKSMPVGSGSGGGVGSGRGPGVGPGWGGGIGGGAYRVGGGVTAPRVIYSPDPEFSEEARKAKFQGTVVLWLIVGPDGRPHEVGVYRSLGVGLDEKAIEAIRQWRFEPGRKDGIPVAVQLNVEVSFRLY
jgi:TonB family protein